MQGFCWNEYCSSVDCSALSCSSCGAPGPSSLRPPWPCRPAPAAAAQGAHGSATRRGYEHQPIAQLILVWVVACGEASSVAPRTLRPPSLSLTKACVTKAAIQKTVRGLSCTALFVALLSLCTELRACSWRDCGVTGPHPVQHSLRWEIPQLWQRLGARTRAQPAASFLKQRDVGVHVHGEPGRGALPLCAA